MSPQDTPARGRFIALEGVDGAGTTTQLDRLAAHFGSRLRPTREPSTGPIGREIRRHLAGPVDGLQLDPAALALLFAADRLDHLRREVEPQLARGVHVVTDRYLLSSLAYQTLEVAREHVCRFNALATPPDLTIFIEVPIEISEARRQKRGAADEIFEKRALQERVRTTYLEEVLLLRSVGEPVCMIDGDAPVDEVFRAVLEAVESCIAAPPRQSL
ncbi:MAG: dTMP kinase [Polyangia bacterium]